MRKSADWRALVLSDELHDGAITDIQHGLDLRSMEFTIERPDSYSLSQAGKEPARYRLRFSRVPVFDLRADPWDDDDRSCHDDPYSRPLNSLEWQYAHLLSPEEVLAFGPPSGDYHGLRIELHPSAELVVVFHSLVIEFMGSAGSPWYQNPDGAR